ncbi:hypothetical protein SOV_25260 [Sporomusa ovata DSM 2662]|uniref:Uncharacterized protein n=1 Tax=Sporomusa ovata TaxID=2378 RepID=A0A0U1L3X5_9FIRM|nr:hypothetical protein [Sporomusa ovata]EQB25839.1 hypothetical protein SOV_4c05060 [Sporomusa ovata DSM 2662]CQR74402.1 hypothetical protein SpAn4DRAFT_0864 [Sporomusa ovata]
MCKYVPKNWPVDTTNQSEQVSKPAKSIYLHNSTAQVTASQYQAGCFKARQMAYLGKKCWI